MLRAGAAGFLVKGSPGHELVAAIRRTVRGEIALSNDVANGVLRDLADELARQEAEATADQHLRSQIRDVIGSSALTAVGQPIVRLDDFAVVGVEALARFQVEPARSPDIWFADADRVGLRIELELAALRRATALLPLVPAECYLAVNLAPTTLLTADLRAIIREVGPRVVVELTEHARVDDYQRLNAALGALREAGCRIAIDDAGAGFASLRHILQLAPDIIKLDLSLTRDIHLDRNRRALATALTSFAVEIDAQIVAEGIETREELATLTSLGINHGQGFYLARPAPLTGDLPRHLKVPATG